MNTRLKRIGLPALAALLPLAGWTVDALSLTPEVSRLLPAAVAVEMQDAAGTSLRTVNGTLVPQGVVVQVSALAKAAKASVRSRSGETWATSEVLATNAAVGLAVLKLPNPPLTPLAFPPSGAYTAKSRVFLLNGPGVGADSVSATIYENFMLRNTGADLCPVVPGIPGAGPVVDERGRFLGVACDLSEGSYNFGYIVPMGSVRVVANTVGQGGPISNFAGASVPAYEQRDATTGLVFRGAVLTKAERWDDARFFLDQALKRDPNAADAYYWSGQALFGGQQFQRAAEDFVLAGQKDATFHLAWHMAGAAQNQAADYNKAIEMYQKALEVKPTAADTYCNLGGAYYNLQRIDDAVAAFRKSIELDPRYARGLAYTNLALVLNGAGRRDEAEAVYRDLNQVSPEWAQRLRAALDGAR